MSGLVSSKVSVPLNSPVVRTEPADSSFVSPKVLAVSFSYPPKTEPRAIQVSRLLRHLDVSTVLVCEGSSGNPSGEDSNGLGAESFLEAVLRVPLSLANLRTMANSIARRVYLPVWGRTPDPLGPWKGQVLKAVEAFINTQGYRPSALVTFAFPLIDNLIGLELKRRYRFPWLAHFSDPWVDSPFKADDRLTRAINARLERKVIESADRLVFTSDETADLVMGKYNLALRSKVRIVPHAYEPDLFWPAPKVQNEQLTIRYLGDLYLSRTPKPLFAALQILSSLRPDLLSKFRFEIVGLVHDMKLEDLGLSQLPKELVVHRSPVSYLESLSLMSSADGLMVIDAPAVNNMKSVFLPSKLIEYVGAGRPIIGLTPPGTAANLINRLGGWVVDPTDTDGAARVMEQFLSFIVEHKDSHRETWGRPEVRREYEAEVVAGKFEEVLLELV